MRPDGSRGSLRGDAAGPLDVRAARFRGARGVAAGTLSAVGALVAHLLAGGSVELVPGLVVTAAAVPLAVRATPRHELGLVRLAGIAALAQVLGHLALMMAPNGSHAAAGAHAAATAHLELTPTMLGTHAAVALATVAVSGGLDVAVLGVLRAAAGWLLLCLPAAPVPVSHRPPLGGAVRRLRSRCGGASARPRAPPFVLAPAACAAR